MPIYDYTCTSCHAVTTRFLPIAKRHSPGPCAHCDNDALQIQISAPRSLYIKGSPQRALTPQQQLAGVNVEGPGTKKAFAARCCITAKAPAVPFVLPRNFFYV